MRSAMKTLLFQMLRYIFISELISKSVFFSCTKIHSIVCVRHCNVHVASSFKISYESIGHA